MTTEHATESSQGPYSERNRKLRETYLVQTAPAAPAKDGRPSVSETVRNVMAKDGYASLESASLYEVFQQSVKRFGNNACLGWRESGGPFKWDTYKAVDLKVTKVASALAHVGLRAHGRVGIYSLNCPEWMVAMQACNRMTFYTVPLYDTFGEKAVEYVVNHSECGIIFVSTKNWQKLIDCLPRLKTVHTIVYWGQGDINRQGAKGAGKKIYSFVEFQELGAQHPAPPVPPAADDLCTIMYTSGTTGDPKGVMLTHSNVLHCIAAQSEISKQAEGVDPPCPTDVFLSWLPLAHIMDRAAEEAVLYHGARIGYWSGSVELLQEDLIALQPTLFIAPPRVWDRVYASAMARVRGSNFLRRLIFNYAYRYKLRMLKQGYNWNKAAPFFDRLVFSKFGAALGGRLRCVFSGSAPLAPHIEEFLRVAMPFFFAQGYGLTETCAVSFFSSSNVWEAFGTVGIPAATHDYRLESVPHMNYDAHGTPPQGEICSKGPCNFKGYFRDPEKTAEVLDADGWFHTGDIGQIEDSGALRIIDRKKQIFKLSQGEYVAPTKVEAVYEQLAWVEQCFVHGYSTESKLVTVVVPNESAFTQAAANAGLSGSFLELLECPKANLWFLNELTAKGKEAGLKGFERTKGLVLSGELFSVDNGLLTPTLKLRRAQLLARYKAQIDAAYTALKEGPY